ncbi:MAG: hypothetical protein HYZ60_08805 [Methylocystis sp.]|nr:hypothetical protein [Methylocystis sp.]
MAKLNQTEGIWGGPGKNLGSPDVGSERTRERRPRFAAGVLAHCFQERHDVNGLTTIEDDFARLRNCASRLQDWECGTCFVAPIEKLQNVLKRLNIDTSRLKALLKNLHLTLLFAKPFLNLLAIFHFPPVFHLSTSYVTNGM